MVVNGISEPSTVPVYTQVVLIDDLDLQPFQEKFLVQKMQSSSHFFIGGLEKGVSKIWNLGFGVSSSVTSFKLKNVEKCMSRKYRKLSYEKEQNITDREIHGGETL